MSVRKRSRDLDKLETLIFWQMKAFKLWKHVESSRLNGPLIEYRVPDSKIPILL